MHAKTNRPLLASVQKFLAVLFFFAIGVSEASAITDSNRVCDIADITSLKTCMQNQSDFDRFNFTSDVSCQGNDCCGANGKALMDLSRSKGDKTILGNGYVLTRYSGQKECPALTINNVSNVSVQNLNLDENSEIAPCEPNDKCPATVHIQNSKNVSLNFVNIYHGKAFVVWVWGVDGFVFDNSSIANAGIIGLCVGHQSHRPSYHVVISNSVFAGARTNGVAITGVDGLNIDDNKIVNNVFSGNHYHGLWMDGSGKVATTGGQLYIARAKFLTVSDNVIADGRCFNCSDPSVWGMELGAHNEGSTLTNTAITRNFIYNSLGFALFKNDGSGLDNTLTITDNKVFGASQFANFSQSEFFKNTLVVKPKVIASISALANSPEAEYYHKKLIVNPNQAFSNSAMAAPSSEPVINVNTSGEITPSLDYSGLNNNLIYQLKRKTHLESQWPQKKFAVKQKFKLSAFPRPHSNPNPIYRCLAVNKKVNDFVSNAKNCDGKVLHSIFGYSYESTFPGARPFYRCRKGKDYFISWDQNCEGKISEGFIGNALPE